MIAWIVDSRTWQKNVLLVFAIMVSFFAMSQLSAPKVYADDASDPYIGSYGCGVGTGSHKSYAGLLVEVYWFDYTGGLHTANDSQVRVWTDDGRGDSDPGNIVWLNSSNLFSSSYPHGDDMTFNQYDSGCGDGHNVVLGYNRTSTRSDGYGPRWALDCDASQYGVGNERVFHVSGVGVPSGARAGGYWETKTFRSVNGYTRTVTIAYVEPPPPDPAPVTSFDVVNCAEAAGWAFDMSNTGVSIPAHLQVTDKNGVFDTKIWGTANTSRPDVNAVYGIGGNHGFSLNISSFVSDGLVHSVSVYTYNINSSGVTTGGPILIGTKTVGPCYNYDLTPSVTATDKLIEAGDVPNFSYKVTLKTGSITPSTALAVKQYVVPAGQDLLTYTSQDNVAADCNNAYSKTLCVATSWRLPNRVFTSTTNVSTSGSSPPYSEPITASYPAGTKICQILALSPARINSAASGANVSSRWSAPECVTIVEKPYFTTTGGDISSGGIIKSWNYDNKNGYAGAGSQLAALAAGNITSFVSGTGLASFGSGSGLAFANTTASGSTYGGGYTPATNLPIVDTTGASAPPATGIASWNGVYTQAGDLTISGNVPANKNTTIVLTSGNLYISGNVTYSYGNLTQIPRLTVIVQNGNIYVNNTVTEIHGVFYAGGTGKGNFYSCATAQGTPKTMSDADAYSTCNKKLTVYGAVSANKLILNRTYGTLHGTNAPASPAENFYYSPEVWLAQPSSTSTSGSGSTVYNSYVSLPPIL